MPLGFLGQQSALDRGHLPADAGVLGLDLQSSAFGRSFVQCADALLVRLCVLDQVVGGVHGESVAPTPTVNATAIADQLR